jgi:hypothetical protein
VTYDRFQRDSVAEVGGMGQWRNVRSDADGILNLPSTKDAASESMLRAA